MRTSGASGRAGFEPAGARAPLPGVNPDAPAREKKPVNELCSWALVSLVDDNPTAPAHRRRETKPTNELCGSESGRRTRGSHLFRDNRPAPARPELHEGGQVLRLGVRFKVTQTPRPTALSNPTSECRSWGLVHVTGEGNPAAPARRKLQRNGRGVPRESRLAPANTRSGINRAPDNPDAPARRTKPANELCKSESEACAPRFTMLLGITDPLRLAGTARRRTSAAPGCSFQGNPDASAHRVIEHRRTSAAAGVRVHVTGEVTQPLRLAGNQLVSLEGFEPPLLV